jgi:ribosomal protein S25
MAAPIDVSWPTADKLIRRFEDQGILQEITGQRRNRVFRYGPCLALFQDAESPGAAGEA